MPLFALTNAGITLKNCFPSSGTSLIAPAIIISLLIGKPLGITGISWLLFRFQITALPENVKWKLFWGAACLCGMDLR